MSTPFYALCRKRVFPVFFFPAKKPPGLTETAKVPSSFPAFPSVGDAKTRDRRAEDTNAHRDAQRRRDAHAVEKPAADQARQNGAESRHGKRQALGLCRVGIVDHLCGIGHDRRGIKRKGRRLKQEGRIQRRYGRSERHSRRFQNKKAELIDNMLDNETSFINKLSKDEILSLFE